VPVPRGDQRPYFVIVHTMKRRTRSAFILLFALLFSGVLALPGMPWSLRLDHGLKRLTARRRVKAASFEGQRPRTALLSGVLARSPLLPQAVKGAEVSVVQSSSGYCSLADSQGRFTIPHLLWYPGAKYNLLVMSDSFSVRRISLTAPTVFSRKWGHRSRATILRSGRASDDWRVPLSTNGV